MRTTFARFGLACALALTVSVAMAGDGPATAKVTKVSGSAQYSTDGQMWQALSKGMTLSAGSIVRTAPGSSVDLFLGGRQVSARVEEARVPATSSLVYFPEAGGEQANMVKVLESSVLSIDTLMQTGTGMSTVSETGLDLRKGSIFFSVKKLTAASKFEIKCPKGIAGVRGTMGWMNDAGVIRMFRGTVLETYFGSDGVTTKTQVIQGRQMFDPGTGLLQSVPDDILIVLRQYARSLTPFGLAGAPPQTFQYDPNLTPVSGVLGQAGSSYGHGGMNYNDGGGE
jgi:hypothetical protein